MRTHLSLAKALVAAIMLAFSTGPVAAAEPLGKGNAQWQKIVKAAEGESLNMMVMTGTTYANVVAAFQKAYPKIKVLMTQARPGNSTARIVTEQKNGQYHWDIFWGPSNSVSAVLVPANGMQDIRPFFVLPSVTDDRNWRGGFNLYAQDLTKRHFTFIAGMNVRTGGFAVNWDKIPKGSIKGWKDLLDPKGRGKIVIYNPTRPITGAIALSCALPLVGENYVRTLVRTQDLQPMRSSRLITDWIVRGRIAIVIGLSSSYLPKYQKRGLGKNIESIGGTVCSGAGGPGINVLKKAPHPNAAKVYLNWFLSKQGQEAFTKSFWKRNQLFSRRKDVAQPNSPAAKAAIAAHKSGKWLSTGSETHLPFMKKVLVITRAHFKSSKKKGKGKGKKKKN